MLFTFYSIHLCSHISPLHSFMPLSLTLPLLIPQSPHTIVVTTIIATITTVIPLSTSLLSPLLLSSPPLHLLKILTIFHMSQTLKKIKILKIILRVATKHKKTSHFPLKTFFLRKYFMSKQININVPMLMQDSQASLMILDCVIPFEF